jgi:hypothetical protein
MAKWDIKDGFWCMECAEEEEWKFACVLPQPKGEPMKLVVPTSLQMSWVESPPYFCTATEAAQDIATEFIKIPVTSLPQHKFTKYVISNQNYDALPHSTETTWFFFYMVEVYVDQFMSLVIPVSKEHLRHVMTAP